MSQPVAAAPPRRRRLSLSRRGAPRGPRWWRNLPPRWRTAIRIGLAAVAAACLLLGALVVYAAMTLPSIDDLGRRTGTMKILDAHGRTVAEMGIDNVNRTAVPLDKVA